MIDVVLALKKRIERFMLADTLTVSDSYAGDTSIQIREVDCMFFDIVKQYKSRPKIGIYIADSNIMSLHQIESVDRSTSTLGISPALIDDIASGSVVERLPGQERINRVFIGDIETIYEFPAIVIAPMNLEREWMTLPTGSNETLNITVSLYLQDDGNEETTLALLSATQELDDLLMADLHLRHAVLPESPADRVYNSMVRSINYGYIQKGTFAIKASQLNWFANQYLIRIVARDTQDFDMFRYSPGEMFGPSSSPQGIDTEDAVDGIYDDIND